MADNDDALAGEGPPEVVAPSPSLLTIVLFVLNLVAALGFGYLLLLDYNVRQAWSYAIFRDDLMIWGLPLADEEKAESASQATRPAVHIDPDKIKEEFKSRRRGNPPGKGFVPVDEVIGQRVRPSQLTDDVLKDLFKGVPDANHPVRTLDEEVDRVKGDFLKRIEEAAAETAEAAKGDAAGRKKLGDLLLPMVAGPWQIDSLAEKIRSAKGPELQRLLLDAGQRRVLVDTLRLVEIRRPTAPKDVKEENDEDRRRTKEALDNAALLVAAKGKAAGAVDYRVPLDQLKDLMGQRFDQAKGALAGQQVGKESYDRRANIAYLLFAVSKARKPGKAANFTEPLYPDGWQRVQVVVGLFEYDGAAESLAHALVAEQRRVLGELEADREGYPMKVEGKLQMVPGFVEQHGRLVKRILDVVGEIKDQEARLARLEGLLAEHKKQYEDRKEHYEDVIHKLAAARSETSLQAAELRRLEQQLFRAQLDLANAAQDNEDLLRQIRQAERAVGRRRKKQ